MSNFNDMRCEALRVRRDDAQALVQEVAAERITRRRFVERALALGLSVPSVAAVLAACGGGGNKIAAGGTPIAMDTALPDKLFYYQWAGMTPPGLKREFKQRTGVEIVESNYASNEDLLAKLKAGATGYDVINPSDFMATIMIKSGLLRPLNMNLIPNISGVEPFLQHPPFDPETDGHKYTTPYTFGSTGIGVRTDKVEGEVTSWTSMWDPAYERKIIMLDAERECFSAACFVLGYSPNTTNDQELEAAKQKLIQQKPLVEKYASDPRRDIVSGNALTQTWDGEMIAAKRAVGVELADYVLPEEGFMLWADAMSIPGGAPSPYAAHLFLNFLLETKIAASIANYSGYQSAVSATQPLVKDAIQRSMRPTNEVLSKGTFPVDLGEFGRKLSDAWTEVRAK